MNGNDIDTSSNRGVGMGGTSGTATSSQAAHPAAPSRRIHGRT